MKKLEHYVNSGGERLRCGYTTGSCATGAAKAAAIMLLSKNPVSEVFLETPAGIDLELEVEEYEIGEDFAIASIKKDSGDDPDSTAGIMIYAKVMLNDSGIINITGGEGIGKISKKGIYGEIGDYAINPGPREQIKNALRKVSADQGFDVIIYAPEGVEISKKTYNENIGIKGGISIIGTKGIVFPMSEEALIKTIEMEIDSVVLNKGTDYRLNLTPGNYGEKYAKEFFPEISTVIVSNYFGSSLRYAYSKGFRKFLLIGHIGKFSKLSVGSFQTHNQYCDLRMEAFVYYLALRGVDSSILKEVDNFVSAEEATEFVFNNNLEFIFDDMEKGAAARIKKYLKDPDIEVEVKIYSMKRGMLND